MGSKTSDISVTSETPNPTAIVLTDKEYLSYLQQEAYIKAIQELTLAIKSRSR